MNSIRCFSCGVFVAHNRIGLQEFLIFERSKIFKVFVSDRLGEFELDRVFIPQDKIDFMLLGGSPMPHGSEVLRVGFPSTNLL